MTADQNTSSRLKDSRLFREQAYTNGEWHEAASGDRFDVTDPATGATLGSCPECATNDVIAAIDAAHASQASFRMTNPTQRAALLRSWAHEMRENRADLATLITLENGKIYKEAVGEVLYAANFLDWFAEEAVRNQGDFIQTSESSHRTVTIREPVGVCGLITPWNFPAAMITRKVGPAIAAGCTSVIKAPAETPFTALALAELADRVGVPRGVINVITANENTAEIGDILTTHKNIRKISFTGSTRVGKLLAEKASATLKRLSLELGGLAPFIVFDDANLEEAVEGAVISKFRAAGQTCVCANAFFVHQSVYEQFVTLLSAKVRQLQIGNGFDENANIGPLIHDRAVSKVQAHVADAKKKGGLIVVGGELQSDIGPRFFQPTVIKFASTNMLCMSEETFGPIAGVIPFELESDVVKMANNCEVGLAGYFYSRDINRCWRVAQSLEVGMVGINTGILSNPASPFGGVKHSGYGREGSSYGMAEYTIVKSMTFGGN
ncbi:succinic semialdehyde dehydrogenase, partial [Aureobasidium melanogenum]